MDAEKSSETVSSSELTDGILYKGDKGPRWGKRHIQVTLTAMGTGILFSTKSMLSIVILAMTSQQSVNENVPYYEWETGNGVIISSILWSSMAFQLVAGHIGKEYGAKWLILGSAAINAIAFCLIPAAASIGGATGVIICRLVQGAAQGSFTPLTACIGGAWVPAEERARMGYIGTIGITVSIIISTVVSGIIAKSSLGWPWAIYLFVIINVIWCVFWYFLGYNNPVCHPTVTKEEKTYIQVSLMQEDYKKVPTPWVKIFTTLAVWGVILAQIGTNFLLTMLSNLNSMFIQEVFAFDIQQNALVSALPVLLSTGSGVGFAFLSDFIITRKCLSVVNTRRTFQLTGVVGSSLSLVLSTVVPPEHAYWVVPFLCFESIFLMLSMVGGSTISGYDLSPTFAPIVYGVAGTCSDAVGLFGPLLETWLISDKTAADEWRLVFIITALVASVPSIAFVLFASDKRQDWGDIEIRPAEPKSEISVIGESTERKDNEF